MDKTLILSMEICCACNLSGKHFSCPSGRSDRYGNLDTSRPLTDEKICQVAAEALALGFRGYFSWHFYNEPTLAIDRIVSLIKTIRAANPEAKFLLWTNGTLIPRDNGVIKYSHFDRIVITEYEPSQWDHVRAVCGNVYIQPVAFDRRIEEAQGSESLTPCYRPFNELSIDHFGNAHLCCQDWRGRVAFGNVWTDDLKSIAARFADLRTEIAGMTACAPEICRHCVERDLTPGGSARKVLGE